MRALLVGTLLAALAGPALATECDPGGRSKTRNQYCNPGHAKYNKKDCEERMLDHLRECDDRVVKLKNKIDRGEEVEKNRREMEETQQFYDELAKERPDLAQKAGPPKQQDEPKPKESSGGRGSRGSGEGGQEGAPQGDAGEAQDALKRGDFEGAEAAATRAIHSDPENPAGWLTRAQARALSGNKDGAKQDARQALALNPTPEQGAAAQYLLGRGGELDRAQSKIPKKLDFGSRAPDLGRGGGKPGEGGRRGVERSFDSAAGEAGGEGYSGGSGSRLTAAQAAAQAASLPGASGVKNEAADRAFGKLRLRDYPGALIEADKAVAEKPDDPRARTIRAAVHNRLGNHEQAEADATAALALKPKDVTALLERGYARYQMGRYAQALEDVDEALSIDALNAMGYLYKGMILEKLQRAGEAVGFYRKAGELDPGLKPVADEAEARLTGKPAAAPAAPSLVQRLASRWKYWLILLVAAGLLLARGMRRAVKPEWATPLTPIR